MLRALSALALLFVAGFPASADKLLGTPRIVTGTNVVALPGGPNIGTWVGGKFTSTPDVVQSGGSGKFGAGTIPFPQNAITTKGTTTTGSTSLPVTSATGVNVGDTVIGTGIPLDVQVASIAGNTIAMSRAATANGTVSIRFGVDRWDLAANVVTNNLGAQNLFIGNAAKGRGTWLSKVGAGGSDYKEVSAATILNPFGGIGLTIGARMSDEATGLTSIFGGQTLIDIDVNPTGKRAWGWYDQFTLRSGTVGGILGRETSIASFQPTADVDPWNTNPTNRTVLQRYDAGIGPDPSRTSDPLYKTPNAISAYVDMVHNGGPGARNGFNIGIGALDTTSGRIAPFALMPPYVSMTWFSQSNTKAWDIYSSVSGANLNFGSLNLRSGEALFGSNAGMGVGVSGAAGTTRGVNFYSNGSQRWQFGATSAGESGSNVGSDFSIARFSDAGAIQDIPFNVTRSTGKVTIKTLNLSNLPSGAGTAPGGLVSGDVWRDTSAANVLKVVP